MIILGTAYCLARKESFGVSARPKLYNLWDCRGPFVSEEAGTAVLDPSSLAPAPGSRVLLSPQVLPTSSVTYIREVLLPRSGLYFINKPREKEVNVSLHTPREVRRLAQGAPLKIR